MSLYGDKKNFMLSIWLHGLELKVNTRKTNERLQTASFRMLVSSVVEVVHGEYKQKIPAKKKRIATHDFTPVNSWSVSGHQRTAPTQESAHSNGAFQTTG